MNFRAKNNSYCKVLISYYAPRFVRYLLYGEARYDYLVVFNNIQGTADQNIDRWISQFKQDETFDKDSIIIKRDSLDSKYVTSIEMYGTYEVPRMGNNSAPVVVQSNYGLLGGVVEFPNSLYFLKAVGNNDLIKENSVSFEEFLYSIELN